MNETKHLTCINCPLGCTVSVELNGDEILSVTGNSCKRGEIYAKKEVTAPTRIVTSTIRIVDGDVAMCSVKTAKDIPKNKIFDVMQAIQPIKINAPVHAGDVILKNVCNTDVDVIATKSVNKVSQQQKSNTKNIS